MDIGTVIEHITITLKVIFNNYNMYLCVWCACLSTNIVTSILGKIAGFENRKKYKFVVNMKLSTFARTINNTFNMYL